MSFLLNPFVFAAAGGDFESIATVTVGSGGASSIEFTSIPGTYQHLQVRLIGRSDRAAAGDYIRVQLNSDTGSNYAWHELRGDGANATATGSSSQTGGIVKQITGASNGANEFGSVVIDILDYTETSKNTTVRSLGGFDSNGDGQIVLMSSLWANTSAVTSLKLESQAGSSNWVEHSTAALYGIKA